MWAYMTIRSIFEHRWTYIWSILNHMKHTWAKVSVYRHIQLKLTKEKSTLWMMCSAMSFVLLYNLHLNRLSCLICIHLKIKSNNSLRGNNCAWAVHECHCWGGKCVFRSFLLGPVVQSVVSLTSSLWVISLTILAASIYTILIFFAEKMHCKSYSHVFSKKIQHICVSLDLNFNESLTNDIVSFEQLGPGNLKHFCTSTGLAQFKGLCTVSR